MQNKAYSKPHCILSASPTFERQRYGHVGGEAVAEVPQERHQQGRRQHEHGARRERDPPLVKVVGDKTLLSAVRFICWGNENVIVRR